MPINVFPEKNSKILQPEQLAGALIEISGPLGGGKTEVTLQLLSRLFKVEREAQVAWVERGLTIYPCALPRWGIPLERVLFVDADAKKPARALWAAQQMLRSQLFRVVVLGAEVGDELVLRRLQLAAERAQAAVILLPSFPRTYTAWPISVQLRVARDPRTGEPQVQTLRFRPKVSSPINPTLAHFGVSGLSPDAPYKERVRCKENRSA